MAEPTKSPQEAALALISGAEKVIKGKRAFLEELVIAIIAGGHILLEDLPGTGKTTVAKTFARLIAGKDKKPLDFKRIQFTPDLLPYDITGVDIFNPEKKSFTFSKGPIFSHIVLADEINRSTPKVQSALLEAMAERQVSMGLKTYALPEPFIVIATQNPIESEGTWRLPEAQLDRFMLRLSLGYPDAEAEQAILKDNPALHALENLKPVIKFEDFLGLSALLDSIHLAPELLGALGDLLALSRKNPAILLGASTRAGLHLVQACKARAILKGRDFVNDEDLEALAVPTLAHRIKTRDSSQTAALLIEELTFSALKRFNPR